jgi:ribose-phosphate pyrophosphokinase
LLFALSDVDPLAERMAAHLGIGLSPHEFRKFEDGEHKARPLISVRDRDTYVLSSLWSGPGESVNDKLCRLLFFIGCLRDGAAGRITAVTPYFGYARKDRKTKARDPVTMRYVAELLEAVGVDRVVAFEIHNVAAYQNAFRCGTEHLDASALFANEIIRLAGNDELTVVSPDLGGGKRAEQVRDRLEALLGRPVGMAFMEKRRSLGVVTGELFAGEVRGRTAVIVDDLISSGTTMARCARACDERGARRVFLAATHGLFTAQASKVLDEPFISGILVTDTVPQHVGSGESLPPKVTVLSAGELLGEAVRRLHNGESITDMLAEAGSSETPPRLIRSAS